MHLRLTRERERESNWHAANQINAPHASQTLNQNPQSTQNFYQNPHNTSPTSLKLAQNGKNFTPTSSKLAQNTLDSSNNKSLQLAQSSDNATLKALRLAENADSTSNAESSATSDIQKRRLDKSIAYSTKEQEYSSAQSLDSSQLESMPSGNGDISSVLKVLPNVNSNNASSSSRSPGEVNPANISISGGLPYQNNFMLDGFEMNNDIDPAGSNSNGNQRLRGGQSQGLNVDASLLDSIVVQDSNISAAYGRFSGGVVEANVRKPRKDSGGLNGWHGNISYQHTRSSWSKYYILDTDIEEFKQSSNENYQPSFTKHAIRASIEGYITQDLGLLASFSTIRSFIPLTNTYGDGSSEKTEQKRQSDNYYIKFFYNPSENLSIEYSFAYMPGFNYYFTPQYKHSGYTIKSGGLQTGLKVLYDTPLGHWSNQISYSRLENSRDSDVNYYTRLTSVYEGQVGSVNQLTNNVNFKSDFLFNSLTLGALEQNFRIGLEAIYQDATRDRREDSHMYIYQPPQVNGGRPESIITGQTWNGLPDSFGFISATATTAYYKMGMIKAGKTSFSTATYGLYGEDDASIDLGNVGEIKARLGLRLDGDNYMNKHKVAPRFSLSYITPAEKIWQTQFTFGANRYYSRNLIAYRFYADAVNNRAAYYRCNVNDAWSPYTNGTLPCAGVTYTNFSNGVVLAGPRLSDLEVPYDDELAFSISQNLNIFNITAKYIHRNGKNQIASLSAGTSASNTTQSFDNSGTSKSDIISIMVQNIAPIETANLKHHYLLAIDWNNTKRNFNTHSADYSLRDNIAYNGVVTTYEFLPAQKYNQPLTFKLSTTHTMSFGRTKWLLNNFFTYKSKYDKIVLETIGTGTCSVTSFAQNPASCYQYNDKTLGGYFNWDMRIGFEVDVYKTSATKHTLYANLDIYNVLNSKDLITLSGEDGILLYGIPSNAAILGYRLGRQFWLQVGYKF